MKLYCEPCREKFGWPYFEPIVPHPRPQGECGVCFRVGAVWDAATWYPLPTTNGEPMMTEDQIRAFLHAYGVGASRALGIEPERIHVKGGEGKEGMIVGLTIDGEAVTEQQLAKVKEYLRNLPDELN